MIDAQARIIKKAGPLRGRPSCVPTRSSPSGSAHPNNPTRFAVGILKDIGPTFAFLVYTRDGFLDLTEPADSPDPQGDAQRLLEQIDPDSTFTPAGEVSLLDAAAPQLGVLHVAMFSSGVLIATPDAGFNDLARLAPEVDGLQEWSDVRLLACDPSESQVNYARWDRGQIQRAVGFTSARVTSAFGEPELFEAAVSPEGERWQVLAHAALQAVLGLDGDGASPQGAPTWGDVTIWRFTTAAAPRFRKPYSFMASDVLRPFRVFDDLGHVEQIAAGDPRGVQAVMEFMRLHTEPEDPSVIPARRVELRDELNDESVVLAPDDGVIIRTRGGAEPETDFKVITNRGNYETALYAFFSRGFVKPGYLPGWIAGIDKLQTELHLQRFDTSILRATAVSDLQRRLEIATFIAGNEPETHDGVTHLRYEAGVGGGAVDAWFTASGRGLVVAFDPASSLAGKTAASVKAKYAGVPADLLALANLAPATGVVTLHGPAALSAGTIKAMIKGEGDYSATGFPSLVEVLLALPEFTEASVAEAVSWWSPSEIADGFAAALERGFYQSAPAALDPALVEKFCQEWSEHGSNDRWSTHYVLLEGSSKSSQKAVRERVIQLVDELGLIRVERPAKAADGEVWIRVHPQIDAELGNWS